jgi:hypothetical protein
LKRDDEGLLFVEPTNSQRSVSIVDQLQLLVYLVAQRYTFSAVPGHLVPYHADGDVHPKFVAVRFALEIPSHLEYLCDLAVARKMASLQWQAPRGRLCITHSARIQLSRRFDVHATNPGRN